MQVFGWGYWDWGESIPPVDLLKWLEPRFLTQACNRWMVDKTAMLQLAFFNGDGVETWQNIWGTLIEPKLTTRRSMMSIAFLQASGTI